MDEPDFCAALDFLIPASLAQFEGPKDMRREVRLCTSYLPVRLD